VEDKEPATHLKTDSEAMDRLRDRTDELELIISSLTIFALFSVPSWLFDKIADIYTHLSTSLAIASTAGITLLAGTSFGLAACFVVHLMARAYWVGLIGLRTVFPDGINWSKTPSLGPLSRQYFRDTLPDIDTVIQNTDRLASSLFAVISMLTLSVLWFGTILTVILVVSGAVGARFGLTNTGMGIGTAVLLMVFFGIPIIVYLLDRQLASRVPRLRDSRIFASLIRFLSRIAGFAYPQRLVRPVQLTLQSNTRPHGLRRVQVSRHDSGAGRIPQHVLRGHAQSAGSAARLAPDRQLQSKWQLCSPILAVLPSARQSCAGSTLRPRRGSTGPARLLAPIMGGEH
jgi:MFS family permease